MSFLSTVLLGLLMSPAITYKLPLQNGPLGTDDENTIDKPYNSLIGIAYKWEWQSQDRMDEGQLMLARVRRESIDKESPKVDIKSDEKSLPNVDSTEPLFEEFSDTTPNTLEATSIPLTKANKMSLLNKEKTTPLTDLKQTTKGTALDEDETTNLSDLEQTTIGAELNEDETTHIANSITQSQTLVPESPLNPTTSKKLYVLTSKTFSKATTVSQINSKDSQDSSNPQTTTNDELLEDITSSSPPKAPKTSPSSTTVILRELTTEHYFTSSSAKPSGVTSISTALEEKRNTQSIMRQCMLTILILAVVCTIFIISTIALAAKLSSMKQKNKLRHPVTYTEMRCISSLMPDNDQLNKPKPKRLKTFASSIEESDGDNTTLNSFLPDH